MVDIDTLLEIEYGFDRAATLGALIESFPLCKLMLSFKRKAGALIDIYADLHSIMRPRHPKSEMI